MACFVTFCVCKEYWRTSSILFVLQKWKFTLLGTHCEGANVNLNLEDFLPFFSVSFGKVIYQSILSINVKQMFLR